MLTMKKTVFAAALALTGIMATQQAFAAIALDRTRVVYNGDEKSISLNISNENKNLPYLAQAWIEDAQGNKITSPLTVLPPVQRVEAGAKSQVKVQAAPAAASLPQDKETLFYFNLREIPPRSNKPNTLQIALQTRIKLFYRPAAIALDKTQAAEGDWVEKITLTRQGDKLVVNNPTPYFLTIVEGAPSVKGKPVNFEPVMVNPKDSATIAASAAAFGTSPVLTYVNDYGGRPKIQFSCGGATCAAKLLKDKH
ncbi:fimbria/pilus periplasmic chaperone [Cronobacter dublinensis]|uniref:fimbria/pilus periplasmic chaperone n=1 Tax=Cronobacter dublinensis TaxID=413497 RepID=UPI001375AAC7|nr:fimbria/pilus periplasmic chaperone [Cronobacter dublinensis]EKY3087312.1 fimbria/pilus periplasmic chaperone [Cronobacter dublinensis]ELQ6228101.1 fimbria/pilus periplasmic chaperone [Cronobacter dublinensis]ELY4005756.1 fimbria/pilus periplasmic chaperone [Cronobacter dublinensis]ELY4407100.1 fimbria/pilus periplasmic chaperone [Cronobacter dublinensis]ELY5817736.1 fimbria/pilus periplasmic chaperone [Cronobacter dublinensis]